ncbi:hypothetical protein Tco_0047490 [Tanacetum coccineum]
MAVCFDYESGMKPSERTIFLYHFNGPMLERLAETNTIVFSMVFWVIFNTIDQYDKENDNILLAHTEPLPTDACPLASAMHQAHSRDRSDHLLTIRNPHKNELDPKEINGKNFSGNSLVRMCLDSSTHGLMTSQTTCGKIFRDQRMSFPAKDKFFKTVKHYFWEDPFLFKICGIKLCDVAVLARSPGHPLALHDGSHSVVIHGAKLTQQE